MTDETDDSVTGHVAPHIIPTLDGTTQTLPFSRQLQVPGGGFEHQRTWKVRLFNESTLVREIPYGQTPIPSINVTINATHGLSQGRCQLHAQYVIVAGGDSNWGESGFFTVILPVKITAPEPYSDVPSIVTISGTGAYPGATIKILVNGTVYGSGPATSSNWSVQASNLPIGTAIKMVATQTLNNVTTAASPELVVSVREDVRELVIESPRPGDVITDPTPTLTGKGQNGARIDIWRQGGDGGIFGTGTVQGTSWSVKLTKPLTSGGFTFHAEQITSSGDRKWSNTVPVTVKLEPDPVKLPVITSPEALSRQNTTFRIGGTGGEAGATMEILRDLNHSIKVGQAAVSGDSWFVDVTDVPGRNGLVARQTVPSRPPVFSLLSRAFDIIPPAVTNVDVTFPSAGIVQFNGRGYESATVVFTITSGPGGTAPTDAQVVNGAWQTTARDWQEGEYTLKVIQKISNGANGWIESAPIELKVTYRFPPPSDVKSTPEYQTIISGKGLLGATVSVLDSDKLTKIAPDAPVRSDNTWSTTAYVSWGPTWDRTIYVHQFLGSQKSASVEHKVRIPPIAPGIDSVSPDGLSPTFTGTCELNAQVNLVFSGSATSYPAVVTGTKWSFQRTLPFTPDIEHTVTATQIAAQQTSPAAVRSFQLYRPMVPVVITDPAQDSEIGHGAVTFKGTGGMKGATVSVWDYVNGDTLGSVTLNADGPWEIVVKMTFGRWVIRAKQVIEGRESAHSDSRVCHVVLSRPEISSPEEDDTLTRTSVIEGSGEPLGYVDVFLGSSTTPFLEKVPIGGNGRWQAEATMPVGNKTIRARQYFQSQTSKDTEPRTYKVVPHSPVVETPATGDHAGRHSMVSGFGVRGDKVKVKLGPGTGPALGEAPVSEDRTWSVLVEIPHAGADVSLVATSSEGAFESAASAPPLGAGRYI
jgi:hypothetical protein